MAHQGLQGWRSSSPGFLLKALAPSALSAGAGVHLGLRSLHLSEGPHANLLGSGGAGSIEAERLCFRPLLVREMQFCVHPRLL